jgi:hypothetical protein
MARTAVSCPAQSNGNLRAATADATAPPIAHIAIARARLTGSA